MFDCISNKNIFKYNIWVPLENYDSNLKAKEKKHEFILTPNDKHVTHESAFPLKLISWLQEVMILGSIVRGIYKIISREMLV